MRKIRCSLHKLFKFFSLSFFAWISVTLFSICFQNPLNSFFLWTKDLNYMHVILTYHLWIHKWERKKQIWKAPFYLAYDLTNFIIEDFPYPDWLFFIHSWMKGFKHFTFCFKLFADLYFTTSYPELLSVI